MLDQRQVFGAGEGVGIVEEEEVLKLLEVLKRGSGDRNRRRKGKNMSKKECVV